MVKESFTKLRHCPAGKYLYESNDTCYNCEQGKYNHGSTNDNIIVEKCYTIPKNAEFIFLNSTDVQCKIGWVGIPVYEDGEYETGCTDAGAPTPPPTKKIPPTTFPIDYAKITQYPSQWPSRQPTKFPTLWPSKYPSKWPTIFPTDVPNIPEQCKKCWEHLKNRTIFPSTSPSFAPSISPTFMPSLKPSTLMPTGLLTLIPSTSPIMFPSISPTMSPFKISESTTVNTFTNTDCNNICCLLWIIFYCLLGAGGIVYFTMKRCKKPRSSRIEDDNSTGIIMVGIETDTAPLQQNDSLQVSNT